jgi:hypothetical protein
MSHHQMLKKLRLIRQSAKRIKPDASWVSATRSTLLMQVRNTLPTSQIQRSSVIKEWLKFFAPYFSVNRWLRTPVFSMALVLFALFGGSLLSVSAAERSLPGDFLYSVKLATEQARLAMTKNPQARVILKTEFTGRRVDEMKQVVNTPIEGRNGRVVQAAEVLKRDMHTLKQQLGEMQEQSTPQEVKDTAKIVDQKTNDVVQALQETKATMTPEEKAKVSEAQAAASDTSVKAIEVLVDAHKTASDVVTEQDVTDALKSHNDTVVKTMAQAVGVDTQSVTSTTTFISPPTTTAMTSSTVAVLEQATEAQKSLTEADKLASENKMDEAVIKIKEGTQQAFAVQKSAEQAEGVQTAANDAAAAAAAATTTTTIPTVPAGNTATSTGGVGVNIQNPTTTITKP